MKFNIVKTRLLEVMMACIVLICLGNTAWGSNYTLSLQTSDGSKPISTFPRGQDLYLHISISDMTGVAGAAFTIIYPENALQFEGTDAVGLSGAVVSPVFNFIQGTAATKTHRENGATAGRILLSGAAVNTSSANCEANPNGGGAAYNGNQTLFTIRFKVKAEAQVNSYNFSLVKTTLSNESAGYIASGAEIPVLVGAVPCSDVNWGTPSLAFPVLDANLATLPTSSFNIINDVNNGDTTPPSGTIVFAEGSYTKSFKVNLKIAATDNLGKITAMKISNENPSSWSSVKELAFEATKSWSLSQEDGLKTVYARFKDAAGNWSDVVSSSITLDTKAPVTAPDWPTGGYKAGQFLPSGMSVKLTATDANPGWTTYYVVNNTTIQPGGSGWIQGTNVNIPKPNAGKTATLRYYSKDAAGNMEAVKTALYSNSENAVRPTGTVAINSGAAATGTPAVTLDLTAKDADGVSLVGISNAAIDCVQSFGTTRPYSAGVSWTLLPGDGAKTVYVCFMDKQNNWSGRAVSDEILLDQTKPNGEFHIQGNCSASFEKTTSKSVTLILNATDALPGQVAFMKFSNDGSKWSQYEAYKTIKTGWALAPGAGEKVVYALFKDQAGNESEPVLKKITLASTCSDVILEYGKGIATNGDGSKIFLVGAAGETESGARLVSWVRYDAFGNKEPRTLELAGYSFGDPLVVDGQGNLYTTGVYSGALYLIKYDSAGYESWHVSIGTAAETVAALNVRNIGGKDFIDVAKPVAGGILLSEYYANGIHQESDAICALPVGDEKVYAAIKDELGNAYLAGSVADGSDAFVSKCGTSPWTRLLGATSGAGGYGLASKGGNVYVTGYVYGNLTGQTNAGLTDCFVTKYDSDGIQQWAAPVRLSGSPANDWGSAVAVDGGGNVYVTGATGSNGGGYEMFLMKYDAGGKPIP